MTLLGWSQALASRVLNGKQKREAKKEVERRIALTQELPPVRIAVVGAGRFAQKHLDVLASFRNVQLVGLANRGGSDLSDMAHRYTIRATFSDYRRMLDETCPEAVFVVVSHFDTVRVAADCLERGTPCLIEKPAGFTSAETAYLARLATENNCLNMVGVNRRYVSVLHNALGSVLQRGPLMGIAIEAPEPIRRQRARAEHDARLYDLWLVANNIHAIDLFRCLGGEVEEMRSLKHSWYERTGDSYTAVMRLTNGCLGTYVSHWHSGGGWILKLYGEGIRAEISLWNMTGEFHIDTGRFPVPIDPIDLRYKPGLYAQNQAFITALALKERLPYPASDLRDSVKTMRLIEQIAGAE